MKKLLLLAGMTCALLTSASGQACNPYFTVANNVKATYDLYNAKNKLTGRTRNEFKDVTTNGNNVSATVVTETIDIKKDAVIGRSESAWRCEDGVVKFRMNVMNLEGVDVGNPAVEVDVSGDDADLPFALEAGTSLKDVNFHVTMRMTGITLMDRDFIARDRKVVGTESVTTPAGTFQAVKLTYITESAGRSGKTTKPMPTTVWYAPEVGMVKVESYKDDKVYSSQLLTKFEK